MYSTKKNLFFTILFSLWTLVSIAPLSAASEFFVYATTLSENKIINSNTEAGYRLSANITRGELAKIAANIGGYAPLECTRQYSDVDNTLGDLCGYILALREAGVISATELYRPRANVSRAEMIKILLGAAWEKWSSNTSVFTDIQWYGDLASYIVRAHEIGCTRSAVLFRPGASSSRGEAFKIAGCVIDYKASQEALRVTVSWEIQL